MKGHPHVIKNPAVIHLLLEQEDRDKLKEKAQVLGIASVSSYLRSLIKSVTAEQEATIKKFAEIDELAHKPEKKLPDWWSGKS